jgi:hypothetical protein
MESAGWLRRDRHEPGYAVTVTLYCRYADTLLNPRLPSPAFGPANRGVTVPLYSIPNLPSPAFGSCFSGANRGRRGGRAIECVGCSAVGRE